MDFWVVCIVVAALVAGIVNNVVNKSYKLKMAKIEKGIYEETPIANNTIQYTTPGESIITDDPAKFTFSNVLILALVGVGISALIALGFSMAFNDFLPAPPAAVNRWGMIGAAAASYAAGAIFVIASYTLSDIYKIGSWPMWKRTIIHFISLYMAFILCSYLGQWIDYSSTSYVIEANVIFVAIYVFISFAKSREYKKQTEIMNKKLNEIQED